MMSIEARRPGASVMTSAYCDHCGGPFDRDHAACERARSMEPPRYCSQCGRRVKVQVTPTSWSARCVEHGPINAP
ncbi:biotin synthase auxiliary protein BsaP [Nonomuraea soli]|uniref:biotin synthase auxiliary protein BsaP n=1 Tax=Nonomuraea soli TaxID=1032476 RepID=UPI00406BB785